jgi:hypothetical protein
MFLAAFSGAAVFAEGEFDGGNGTKDEPWLISTPRQLAALNSYLGDAGRGKYFKLSADIDLGGTLADGVGWRPIGGSQTSAEDADNAFRGNFDGAGHIVTGLWINCAPDGLDASELGLFGLVSGASIENLGVLIYSGGGDIYVSDSRRVSAGGLVGHLESGKIENCYVMGNIRCEGAAASSSFGGLVGSIGSSGAAEILNCYYSGAIIAGGAADSAVGGLAGSASLSSNKLTILNSYAKGSFLGARSTGGLVGEITLARQAASCDIKDSYVSARVTGMPSSAIAGIYYSGGEISAGRLGIDISGCYYNNDIGAGNAVFNSFGLAGGASSRSPEDMKRWSAFEGWDEEVWGIREEYGTPYLRSFGNDILVTPKSDLKFSENWEYPSPGDYDVSGMYAEGRELTGYLCALASGSSGRYTVGMGTLSGPYQISFVEGVAIKGVYPADIDINIFTIYNLRDFSVEYTVRVVGDNVRGTPSGYIDLYLDGRLIAGNIRLDEAGSAVYRTNQAASGIQHNVSVEYSGGNGYLPSHSAEVYTNSYWIIFAVAGALVLLGGAAVLAVAAARRRRAALGPAGWRVGLPGEQRAAENPAENEDADAGRQTPETGGDFRPETKERPEDSLPPRKPDSGARRPADSPPAVSRPAAPVKPAARAAKPSARRPRGATPFTPPAAPGSVIACGECGEENPSDMIYCAACGARL